jgi:hypothetical protein
VARYAKPARLNQQLQALPKKVLEDLERRAAELPKSLPSRLSDLRSEAHGKEDNRRRRFAA